MLNNNRINVFEQIKDVNIPIINDDNSVKVKLKNESTFAYSAKQFAINERLQIREITDDLLSRII